MVNSQLPLLLNTLKETETHTCKRKLCSTQEQKKLSNNANGIAQQATSDAISGTDCLPVRPEFHESWSVVSTGCILVSIFKSDTIYVDREANIHISLTVFFSPEKKKYYEELERICTNKFTHIFGSTRSATRQFVLRLQSRAS